MKTLKLNQIYSNLAVFNEVENTAKYFQTFGTKKLKEAYLKREAKRFVKELKKNVSQSFFEALKSCLELKG